LPSSPILKKHWKSGRLKIDQIRAQKDLQKSGLLPILIEFNEVFSIECRRVETAFLRLIGEQLTSFEQLKQKVVNKLAKAQFQHEQIRSVRKAKNELEMATSWNRGFTLMYQ
jgi:SOS response regulatory protein OraA/RecX